jgi:alpha-glucosidase (family GH31 glycosyl hydrolase)
MRTYIMRNAQWASVHPSMSMGQGPWTFGDATLEKVVLEAARLHDRLWPYFYSQAVRFYLDGYPWTMAPLPIAFPADPAVYGRDNERIRGFEWMIGDALLATPLYGNDFETAQSRDVYLPAGVWMDYDTGERHQGPKLLKNFPLPPGKTPLFAGGTGIVVEKRGSGVVARIYPVASHAETRFFHRDGQTSSTIRVNVSDWKKVSVSTSAGRRCNASWQRHALEFPIVPGEDYELR